MRPSSRRVEMMGSSTVSGCWEQKYSLALPDLGYSITEFDLYGNDPYMLAWGNMSSLASSGVMYGAVDSHAFDIDASANS